MPSSFRDLHLPGTPLVMPNPWDVGSARILAAMGFAALATTSAGFAHSLGRPDAVRAVSRDEAITHARAIGTATGLPVNADLERCFADGPAGAAETVTMAAASGIAGASIEDATGIPGEPIYDLALATARVQASAEAASNAKSDFVLTARAEGFLWGRNDLTEVIRRLQAFANAGADVVYAPGLPDTDTVRAVVESVDVPVNVLPAPGMTVAALADIGVARISVGSAMSRNAYGALMAAAREVQEEGTFTFASAAVSFNELNEIFLA